MKNNFGITPIEMKNSVATKKDWRKVWQNEQKNGRL